MEHRAEKRKGKDMGKIESLPTRVALLCGDYTLILSFSTDTVGLLVSRLCQESARSQVTSLLPCFPHVVLLLVHLQALSISLHPLASSVFRKCTWVLFLSYIFQRRLNLPANSHFYVFHLLDNS